MLSTIIMHREACSELFLLYFGVKGWKKLVTVSWSPVVTHIDLSANLNCDVKTIFKKYSIILHIRLSEKLQLVCACYYQFIIKKT